MKAKSMEFILDMVHHNPGEPHFQTVFTRPETLVRYGYNGWVGKNVHCALSFGGADENIFPVGGEQEQWIKAFRESMKSEADAAKKAGLKVFYHIDLFVLPTMLVEKYRNELCDKNGRIALNAPMTKEVHREMFQELFELFPEIDGLIIRVGETYLYDMPYHTGNGPIRAGQYEKGEETIPQEIERYVDLIRFLREEVCIKHDRYMIFRTWDCFPDRFHADKAYYLQVTEQIPAHEKLIFSIKHTALDFWRRVRFNPCIGAGKHRQLIEVQCQREYEGKGAYPDYIMEYVIDGFPENKVRKGLRSAADNPLVCGIYSWSRGGGWYGPYIENELWCRLHAYVLAGWAGNPEKTSDVLLKGFCKEQLQMDDEDCALFGELCRLSGEAVLKGRYCEPYDRYLEEKVMPANLWMRDDRLGGKEQIEPVFQFLAEKGLLKEALEEKRQSMLLWNQIEELSQKLHTGIERDRKYIQLSAGYGNKLFEIIFCAWHIWTLEAEGKLEGAEAEEAFLKYDMAWNHYRILKKQPDCPSLYVGKYLNLPGTEEIPGMDAYMEELRKRL